MHLAWCCDRARKVDGGRCAYLGWRAPSLLHGAPFGALIQFNIEHPILSLPCSYVNGCSPFTKLAPLCWTMNEEPYPSWDINNRQDTPSVANHSETAMLKGMDNISMTDAERTKKMAILQACRSHSLETLVTLATTEHGLIDDEVRKKACTFYGSGPTRQVELTWSPPRANPARIF